MARVKQTFIQRDFSLGETRKEFLEGDDLDIRRQSLRKARNVRVLATRSLEARPGTFVVRQSEGAQDIIEIMPESDAVFAIVPHGNVLRVIDAEGSIVWETAAPWPVHERVWAEPFREKTIIGTNSGTSGLWLLRFDGGWSLEPFSFEFRPGGEKAQPYWVFNKGVTLQPSGRTGSVTLTASSPVFTDAHIGTRVRYARRELEITARTTSSVVQATAVRTLPPSFRLTVENASQFAVGEAVVGAETNYQGVIVAISGNDIDVVTLEYFDGPDAANTGHGDEELVGAAGASKITAKTEISPLPTTVWDEALMSPVYGWPRSAGAGGGRVFFTDFPKAPSVIAVSSARGVEDFSVGAADDDAIAREMGDGAPRFLHVISAGDVILLSDRGCYYVPLRDGGVITPSSFQAILFDKRGANRVRPVQVEDGVVFVEASGQQIAAALLDGNIYLKWSVRTLTVLHDQVVKGPVALCGPSLNAASPEKYMFAVNEDGTLATVSWGVSIREESAGFVPWDTDGAFAAVSPVFGGYWAIVDRENGRFIERFDNDAYLDGAIAADGPATVSALDVNGDLLDVNGDNLIVSVVYDLLAGQTVQMWDQGWFVPVVVFDSQGSTDVPIEPTAQLGRNFISTVGPWPVEHLESPRVGFMKARVIRMSVSVQDTMGFKVRTNGAERIIGSYDFGDDLSEPPQAKTKVYRFTVFGNRDHPDLEITKHEPGPFRVLAIGQEVQA